MWSAAVVLSLLALVAVNAGPTPTTLKICVPHNALEACHRMVEEGHSVGVAMDCVAARDRLDCISILKEHKADFEAVDPEDMYIAAKSFADKFNIFKEIRTKEEPEAEFRYEAVVVVHKDLSIKNVEGLRGLKSCHTGVGRNVGYKIPITKLTHMGVLPPLNDTTLSPRENELKALSTFFSKSCIVGKWSPDQELNKRLKQQYHNLCELCEFPDNCDYPDQNSGYEGALRCLAIGGGDVAFTKVIFVNKFFGLAYGSQPAAKSEYNSEDFAYFCPDGSKKAISGGDGPCTWAARPWQGYMSSADESQDQITALREAIAKLNDLGESTHADWFSKVLALNDKTLAKDNKQTFTPLNYLNKAKYVDVIERDVLEPRRTVRLCVSDEVEASKCEDLARGAYSRDIRPAISCVTKPTIAECFTGCKNNEIDVVSVDSGLAINAIRNFNLQAVLKEEYENDHKKYAVAVVKKSSSYQSLADLKTHKACFSEVGEAAGWVTPVHNLIAQRLIEETDCPYTKAVADFFSAGVENTRDPMKCLAADEGDVAFTDYDNVVAHVGEGGKSTDYELICADGTRKQLDQYASCNLASVPPRVLLSNKDLSPVAKDDILFAMLSAADLYNKHPEYFDLFGSYNNHPNVLFSNAAVGLETIHEDDPFGSFTKLHDNLSKCTPEKSKP